MLLAPPSRKLVEAIPIIDDYCMELAAIETVGPCLRFVLASEQTAYETGEKMWVVQRKVILPLNAVRPAIELTLRFLGSYAAGPHIIDLVK